MTSELTKRIITSFFLISLFALVFFNKFILIISLITVSLICWIEFSMIISKIFNKDNLKNSVLKFIIRVFSLIYIVIFSLLIFEGINQIQPNYRINMFYLFSVCICSDIGGLLFGKIFKGKKLTKISPNKTISGSIGSFILSILLVPFFYYIFEGFSSLLHLAIISIIVSFFCQLGDLFISYMKRNAKVKDTSNLLPGHGGLLDRLDGMLLALPIGMISWEILITI